MCDIRIEAGLSARAIAQAAGWQACSTSRSPACTRPGIGWEREAVRGAGHWRESLRDRAGTPGALAAASSTAMIAAGAATRKSRIPSGQYIADAAAAVILASP